MALQVDTHVTTPVAPVASLQNTPAPTVKAKPVTPSEPTVKTPVKVAAPTPAYTVKLSLSAHIHQLKSQGQDPGQIATSLGIDTRTVNTFLNTAANEPPVAAPLPGSDASSTSSSPAPAPTAPATPVQASPAATPAVAAKTTVAQTALDASQAGAAAEPSRQSL